MTNLDLKSEGDSSMSGKQRPGGDVETARCGTRVIWQKLDCLKPNLQTVYTRTHRKDVCNRCCVVCRHGM